MCLNLFRQSHGATNNVRWYKNGLTTRGEFDKSVRSQRTGRNDRRVASRLCYGKVMFLFLITYLILP